MDWKERLYKRQTDQIEKLEAKRVAQLFGDKIETIKGTEDDSYEFDADEKNVFHVLTEKHLEGVIPEGTPKEDIIKASGRTYLRHRRVLKINPVMFKRMTDRGFFSKRFDDTKVLHNPKKMKENEENPATKARRTRKKSEE